MQDQLGSWNERSIDEHLALVVPDDAPDASASGGGGGDLGKPGSEKPSFAR
jgi:hypothetical protein